VFEAGLNVGLYEWSGGQAQLVSELPGGEPAIEPVLGYKDLDVRNAVSNDGSRIIWSERNHHIYLTDMLEGQTTQLDTVQGGSGGGQVNPKFQTASSDGSKIFFTDEQKLTHDSTAAEHEPNLYEFKAGGGGSGLDGELIDLTVAIPREMGEPESAHIRGVAIGASEEGTYLYIVAAGILADNANSEKKTAVAGGDNLYLLHETGTEWKPEFIAALTAGDGHDWSGEGGFREEGGPDEPDLGKVTSRVSPNGRFIAFMSENPLTGYDNRDVTSEANDEEVFLYDAESRRLSCVSCDPTGARPTGVYAGEDAREGTTLLVDRGDIWTNRWLAGSIPGWSAINA
jgi:hypothetical protein